MDGAKRLARPTRPIWWWFALHGAIVAAWGGFTIVSPLEGAAGWVLDGIAFGVMLATAGAALIVQGLVWRRHAIGWFGIFAGGVVALCFSVGCFVAGAIGDANAMFLTIVVFLAIEGAVLIAGTFRGHVFRWWGLLMGGIVYLALVVLVALHATAGGDWFALDLVIGALGVLYGAAMVAAAIQVRHAALIQQAP